VRGQFTGVAFNLAVIGVAAYGFMEWKAVETERQNAACKAAQQHLEALEILMRSMAAGLSVEAYAEAERAEVEKLVRALDTATNDAEVRTVIDAHAAELQEQVVATAAALENQGSQLFLEQQLKTQRIPSDVIQEMKRAEKAVTDACN
jgi:hypothetical protein